MTTAAFPASVTSLVIAFVSSAPSGRMLGAKRFTNPWISMD